MSSTMKAYHYRNLYCIKRGAMGEYFIGAMRAKVPGGPTDLDDPFWFGVARTEGQAKRAIAALCNVLGLK